MIKASKDYSWIINSRVLSIINLANAIIWNHNCSWWGNESVMVVVSWYRGLGEAIMMVPWCSVFQESREGGKHSWGSKRCRQYGNGEERREDEGCIVNVSYIGATHSYKCFYMIESPLSSYDSFIETIFDYTYILYGITICPLKIKHLRV